MPAPHDSSAPGVGILTIDVEDWYHSLIKDPARWDGLEDRIVEPTVRLLDLLARAGASATFYVLGDVAARHPDLVRRIRDAGHEVGCHGHQHLSLEWLDADAFARDLERSLEALSSAGAEDVDAFRAPYFSLNERTAWALPVLERHGIRTDSSIFPLRFGYYGEGTAPNVPHARGGIEEFPITLPEYLGVRLPITGGFYMRFFPASWTAAAVRRVARSGRHPMMYVHPWEIDPGHPRVEAGRFITLRHYLRLDRTEATLARLLKECTWKSVREVQALRAGAAT
jgi:polysaccharide deacetylase family protein (PEP-CTERM system associated)